MHTLVSTQPVESHPASFLHPYQGCFPASDSPTKLRSKQSQKPAELGSKVLEETFPTRMQMTHMCIPLQVSEFAQRGRRAGCYHKHQETSSLREIKMRSWGRRAKGKCGGAQGNLSYTAWLILMDTADHSWGHNLPRCRDVLFLLHTPWAFGRDVGDHPALTQSTNIIIYKPQSGIS